MGRNAQSRQKIVTRLRPWLGGRPTLTLALFNFFNGAFCIGLIAAVAHWTNASFIFPSLGATAFMIFYAPLAPPAAPRNVVLGHLVGALVGWCSLALFGLLDEPAAYTSSIGWARVGAAALSLGTAAGLMVLLRAVHPPAAATSLIVSLGLMPDLKQLPILMGAVLLLVLQASLMHRFFGIPYPRWEPTGHHQLPPTPEAPCGTRCPGPAVCAMTCRRRSDRLGMRR